MSENRYRAILAIAAIGLFVFPVLVAAAATTPVTQSNEEVPWWEDTLMDKDKDGIDDDIWVALNNTDFEWVDEKGHIKLNCLKRGNSQLTILKNLQHFFYFL